MKHLATIPTKAAIQDLLSTECACGASKKPRMTFCRRDYGRLPIGLKEALWERCGEGYEAAYAAALGHLLLESPALKAEPGPAAQASPVEVALSAARPLSLS